MTFNRAAVVGTLLLASAALALGCAGTRDDVEGQDSGNSSVDSGNGNGDAVIPGKQDGMSVSDGAQADKQTGKDGWVVKPDTKPWTGVPKDGKWVGKYIKFTVSASGTSIWVHDLDYTTCKKAGCEDSATLSNCHTSCNVSITTSGGKHGFKIASKGIEGSFTSSTTAKGTGKEPSTFCGCTIQVYWDAKWVSAK